MQETLFKTYLLQSFEEFYKEIIKQKHAALTCPYKDSDAAELTEYVTNIASKLEDVLSTQAINSLQVGGHIARQYYTEAQYLMCALADEIFLNLNWAGKSVWENSLLESKFFSSHTSGEVFFQNLDDFLNYPDPVKIDLAILYLISLGIGFKGKYKDMDDGGRITAYKNQLFLFINRKTPELFRGSEKIFRQPYGFTIKSEIPKNFPSPYRWYWAFSIMIGFFVTFSYVLLHFASMDIDSATQSIIRISSGKE